MQKFQNQPDNSKYNRINSIYNLLSNNTVGMTSSELASKFDVDTRTIKRDFDDVLSSFGGKKEGRYWKIDPSLKSDNLGANERVILGILDQLARSGGKTFYSKAHPLIKQISQQLEHPIFTSISSESLEEENIILFERIENAIKQKVEITFKYEKNNFKVKPLKLVFFDGYWYLLALDSNHEDIFKKFHLKTILNVDLLEAKFEVPTLVEKRLKHANSIWFNLNEPFLVRLFLDKDIRKYFERKPLRNQAIVGEDNDGSIEIQIEITNEMEIIPVILYYIPFIKVLEPQWLADIVKEKVVKYIDDLEA